MNRIAGTPLAAMGLVWIAWVAVGVAQDIRPGQDGEGSRLHNGWRITPAGQHITTADMPAGCAASPDGSTLAMVSSGNGEHTVYLFDAATGALRQSVPVGRAWNGTAWSADSATLYVSGGVSGMVHILQRQADGSVARAGEILIQESGPRGRDSIWLGGLALGADGKALYAAGTANDTIYRLDVAGRSVAARRRLNVGSRPTMCNNRKWTSRRATRRTPTAPSDRRAWTSVSLTFSP